MPSLAVPGYTYRHTAPGLAGARVSHRGTRREKLMRQPDGNPAVLTTRLDAVLGWVRKNSLWPLPFGTACCAIEFMSAVSSHYDLARFGAEVVRFSPRQADMMIVSGTGLLVRI